MTRTFDADVRAGLEVQMDDLTMTDANSEKTTNLLMGTMNGLV